jgi:Cu(I)/Ag(I) efflux system membrane fusion protein
VLAACQNGQSDQQHADTGVTADANLPKPTAIQVAYPTDDKMGASVNRVVDNYLAIKDALVASDLQQTNMKTGDLIAALNGADTAALAPEAAQKWTEHRKIMERAATSLQAATEIKAKRASFEDLSKAAYALVSDFGAGQTLYKEYCPMAFNDKGAYWLSAKSEIRNPYFGDKMLECGEVQEVLSFQENSSK